MAMTPEGRVKNAVKKLLFAKGFIQAGSKKQNWPENPIGWYYMPVQSGLGVTGIPDFICSWEGRLLGIETKAPGKRANTSANQDARIEEIRTGRGLAIVVDDVSQLEELLGD